MASNIPESIQKNLPGIKLSVSVCDVEITSVAATTLHNIWQKAERLLNTPHAIAPAPGNSSARMVASESSPRPHFVQWAKGAKFVRDDSCPMWRG